MIEKAINLVTNVLKVFELAELIKKRWKSLKRLLGLEKKTEPLEYIVDIKLTVLPIDYQTTKKTVESEVPRYLSRKMWGLLSDDCDQAILTEEEIALIRMYMEFIDMLETGIRPATFTPVNVNIVNSQVEELIDMYQMRILTICRTAKTRRARLLEA